MNSIDFFDLLDAIEQRTDLRVCEHLGCFGIVAASGGNTLPVVAKILRALVENDDAGDVDGNDVCDMLDTLTNVSIDGSIMFWPSIEWIDNDGGDEGHEDA